MTRKILIGMLTLALTVAGAPLFAGSESDGGYFDVLSDGGKVGNRFVTWVWSPHYLPGGIDYTIFLLCERYDSNGFATGNNKVVVKDIAFLGFDRGHLVEYRKVSRRMSKFRKQGYLTISAPELETLTDETFVIAEVQFQVKGRADAGDQIRCSADVTETPLFADRATRKAKPALSGSLIERLR